MIPLQHVDRARSEWLFRPETTITQAWTTVIVRQEVTKMSPRRYGDACQVFEPIYKGLQVSYPHILVSEIYGPLRIGEGLYGESR